MKWPELSGLRSKSRAKNGPPMRLTSASSGAPVQLKTPDRSQDKPARKQPEQKRHHLDAEARQHRPLVGHQPAIPGLRDIGSADIQDRRIKTGLEPRPRLKFRRHRAGTKCRHAYAAWRELPAQRFGE